MFSGTGRVRRSRAASIWTTWPSFIAHSPLTDRRVFSGQLCFAFTAPTGLTRTVRRTRSGTWLMIRRRSIRLMTLQYQARVKSLIIAWLEAADGTGGLYRLRAGTADLAQAKFATWLSKPAGVSYKDFYTELEPLTTQPGVALWGRQMTLGPTTEFCIHSQTTVELSASTRVLRVQLDHQRTMI